MKILRATGLSLMLVYTCTAVAAPRSADTQAEVAFKRLDFGAWGRAIDPAGDCKFNLVGDQFTIAVPGSPRAHNLSVEKKSMEAPRVLQPVNGDFALEVRVDGKFHPGKISTEEGRTPYFGAGLLVMID